MEVAAVAARRRVFSWWPLAQPMSEPTEQSPAAAPGPDEAPADAPAEPDPRDHQLALVRAALARARADYDNLQKRVARDAAAERERTKARVLEGLLPVYELARMAAHQAEAHPGPLSEGVVLLAREFARLLEREGLAAVDAVGVPFDPGAHEAVAQETAHGIKPGHVARIIQPGYRMDGKVLRYAKVAVAPPAGHAGDDEA
jgi:molecular chaperone GrpE